MIKNRYTGRSSYLSLYHSNSTVFQDKSNLIKNSKRVPLEPMNEIPQSPQPEVQQQQSSFMNEPIADVGVPEVLHFNTDSNISHRKDLIFPALPDLKSATGVAFDDLLSQKLHLCSQLCDFDDQMKDVEAKSIKTETLKEIIAVYSDTKFAKGLSLSNHAKVLDMIKKNIFRQIPPVPEIHLAYDEEPKVVNNSMAHLNLVYLILIKMISILPYELFAKNNLIESLFNVAHSPDLSERDTLSQVLVAHFMCFQDSRQYIINRASSLLIEYRQSIVPPFCVWPSLILFFRIFKQSLPSINSDLMNVFWGAIVPLLTTQHLCSFIVPLRNVIDLMVSINSSIPFQILLYSIKQFPILSSSKQFFFIELLNSLAEKLRLQDFSDVSKPLFKLYARSAISQNARVADASFKIWSSTDMVPRILDNAKVIFPIVHNSIVRSSREHWNSNVQNKALSVLKSMRDINPFLFEELNSQRIGPPKSTQGASEQKMWAIIARKAAKTDRDVNLAAVLGEVQLSFNTSQPLASISSSGGYKISSRPKICNPKKKGDSNPWR